MYTNTFIVYTLINNNLFCSLANEELDTFVALLSSGKGGSICKNEFETRDEAEDFAGRLALSCHGLPLFAYDKENAPCVEAVERNGQAS